MKSAGWRLFCLIAFPLTLGLAEEAVTSHDFKTEFVDKTVTNPETITPEDAGDTSDSTKVQPPELKRFINENIKQNDIMNQRPGDFAPQRQNMNQPPVYLGSAPSNGQPPPNNEYLNSLLNQNINNPQGYISRGTVPGQNEYAYAPNPNMRANQILTNNVGSRSGISANQDLVSGSKNQGVRSGTEIDVKEEERDVNEARKSFSRLVPHSERILLHEIPGAKLLLTCTREGELHNFWSTAYQCLVCACIRDHGVLRPVCASCAGCMAPSPEIIEGTEADIPETPRTTPLPPYIEEVTCRPLPSGQPFDNPLHPCQVCICIESVNMYGKPDVHIKCQENPQCVLPSDVTVLPPISDESVPLPHCDKFPLNVLFPHPSDICRTCQCSVQLSQLGVPEKHITCLLKPDCYPISPDPEIISEPPEIYPVTPYYHIPTEHIIIDIPVTPEPSPWTPATRPPAPVGPLPGPSPHDSCRPYVPNQPFQHPWDECQMCVCTEAFAKLHINIEVNCFTKKSCCIESPFETITQATLPPVQQQQSGKLKIHDAICEYKTFGVEFNHPNDPCKICTCELQGRLITPLCKRSSNPECQVVTIYPTATLTLEELFHENSNTPQPGSGSLYNAASLSSQNNAFVSNLNPYGSSGLQTSAGSGLSSAEQYALSYNQWKLPNTQRPGDMSFRPENVQRPVGPQFNPQNAQSPGGSYSVYGPQTLQKPGNPNLKYESEYGNGLQGNYPQSIQGRPGYQVQPGGYSQNYPGYRNQGQGYPGYQQGLVRPTEVISQSQSKASASASSGSNYAYAPGYRNSGGQGQSSPELNNANMQFSQNSASAQSNAQASSVSAIKYKGRSGNPDDDVSSANEN